MDAILRVLGGDFIPIAVVSAVPHEGGIRFLCPKDQVDLKPTQAEAVWRVLELASGYNDLQTIADLSDLPLDTVEDIVRDLVELGLMTETKMQYQHLHRISSLPSTYDGGVFQTPAADRLAQTKDKGVGSRTSHAARAKCGHDVKFDLTPVTVFRKGKTRPEPGKKFSGRRITKEQIGEICRAAFHEIKPLEIEGDISMHQRLYIVVSRAQDGVTPGYYEVTPAGCILYNEEVDEKQLAYAFNTEGLPFNASVQLILAADLGAYADIHGNRGYREGLMETGKVISNIESYCHEEWLDVYEMTDFLDEALKVELDMPGEVWPLVVLPLGYLTDEPIEDPEKTLKALMGADNYPVKQLWTSEFGEYGTFFGAMATFEATNGRTQFAGATSTSEPFAIMKATIEAYERYYSSVVRVDFRGSATELPGRWLSPNEIAPLVPEDLKINHLTPFDQNTIIDWVKGENETGWPVFIPTDLVYYGQPRHEGQLYYANSSGIAAHFDLGEAKKRGLTELIERDGLMRTWYTRRAPYLLERKALPVHIQHRIDHWMSTYRHTLYLLQIPSDYGWVFLAVVTGVSTPAFVSGAAATIDKSGIEAAMIKALEEAEFNLLLALKTPSQPISAEDVHTPSQHGMFYHDPRMARSLHWLTEGLRISAPISPKLQGYDKVAAVLDPVTVDISPGSGAAGLKIVRVFAKDLVPISFGYHLTHYTHKAVIDDFCSESLAWPHFFA